MVARGLLCEEVGSETQYMRLGGSAGNGKEEQRAEATWHTGLATVSILFLTPESLNKNNYLFPCFNTINQILKT